MKRRLRILQGREELPPPPTVDEVVLTTTPSEQTTITLPPAQEGLDFDFRIEGTSENNLLLIDASESRVGIGTAAPQAIFTVSGDTVSPEFVIHNDEGEQVLAIQLIREELPPPRDGLRRIMARVVDGVAHLRIDGNAVEVQGEEWVMIDGSLLNFIGFRERIGE